MVWTATPYSRGSTLILAACQEKVDDQKTRENQAAAREKQGKNDEAIWDAQQTDCKIELTVVQGAERMVEWKRNEASESSTDRNPPVTSAFSMEYLEGNIVKTRLKADQCKNASKQRWLAANSNIQPSGAVSVPATMVPPSASAAATAAQPKAKQDIDASQGPTVSTLPAPTIVGRWKCLFLDSSVERHYAIETYSDTGKFDETMLFDQPDSKDFVKSVSGTYTATSRGVRIHFTDAIRGGDANLLQTSGDFESRITFLTEDQLNYVEVQGGRETNAENCERLT